MIKVIFLEFLKIIEPYYILSLVIVGLLGNSVSFVFFMRKTKKRRSNLILSWLAVSDNGFLIALFIIELKYFGYDLFNRYDFICKSIVYFTYIFSFLSIWFIALFSLERLIAVKYPIKRYKLINLEREKRTITCFVLFSFFFFAHSIAITHVEINPESRLSFCTTHDEWYELANVMSKVVAVVSIILPLMLIVFSNVTIAYELFRSKKLVVKIYNRKKIRPLRSWSRSRSNQTVEVNLETLNSSTVTLQQRRKSQSEPTALDGLNKKLLNHSEIYSSHNRSRSGMRRLTLFEIELISYSQELNRSRKYSKTTKTLLTISVTYIMLNFLMCMSKLKRLTLVSRDNQIETLRYNESYSDIDEFSPIMDFYKLDVSSADSNTEEINLKIIDLLTCFTYYLNYSINFFLYVVNLTEFKKMLKKIVKLN